MDLWVVAAATGAASIAKYLQNQSSKDPEEASSSSQPIPGNSIHGQSEPRNFLQQIRDRTFPSRGLARNQTGQNLSLDTEETNRLDDIQATREASTSGFQESENRNEVKNDFSDQSGDLLTGFSIREVGVFGRVSRSRQRKCRSNGYVVKPVSSLESCFVAQLYREHARMEEYVYSSIQSPSKLAVRPLLVTDGSRVISTSFNREIKMQSEGLEGQMKLKPSIGKAQSRRLSSSSKRVFSGGEIHSQGSSNGMFLFFLGITIGIMSTIVASKREVDKLNDQLKQTKNLVENLHKELEMKDSVTIKELSNEDFESRGTKEFSFLNFTPIASSIKRELDKSTDYDDKEPDNQRVENSEAMSKIEAELEVELERLELNMKTYSLERISDYVELDPNFVVDVVHGDLRPDNCNRQPGVLSDSNRDVSGTSSNHIHTANYTVSPRELSLRLHEVIQLQLEAHIKELENALENSQKRLHSKESKHIISQSDFYTEKKSSSTQENRTFVDEGSDMDGPLFVDFSGEALETYKTHEEITRMTITDEEALSDTIYYSDCIKKEFNPIDQKLFQGQNGDGGGNGFISQCDIIEESWSRNLDHDKISWREENTSRRWGSYEIGESEDVDEEDDEVAKVLIKRIVEKAKQGSSVVLNAQRMLYSIDDQLIS